MFSLSISKGKFTILWVAAILFFGCLIPQSVFANGSQMRILVAPKFKNISGVEEVDRWAIPDLLTTGFKRYRFIIIEKEAIPEILNEIAFNEEMRGIIDPETITELKGLGANFYVTGKITKLREQIIIIVKIIDMAKLTVKASKIIAVKEQDTNIPEKIDQLASQLVFDIFPPMIHSLIWEIGYDDDSFREFNQLPEYPGPFPWNYNAGDPPDTFPKEINDGARNLINIHYSLTEEQVKNDLILTLDTAGGQGGDFSVQVITKDPGGTRHNTGQYRFDAGSGNPPDKHEVTISREWIKPGTNTIILKSASSPWTNRWLFWDYISLKMKEEEPPLPEKALVIYDDSLASGWSSQGYSWDYASLVYDSNDYVHTENSAIAATLRPWGGLAFAYQSGISTEDYDRLEFYIHGGQRGGQRLRVFVNDRMGNGIRKQVSLNNSQYIKDGTVGANVWKKVSIPLADLDAVDITIVKINIVDNSGSSQPTFYIDDIALTGVTSQATKPSITIKEIVSNDYILGEISGLTPKEYKQYKVVVYVKTDKWYIHPYADGEEGLTYANIKENGSWQIQTVKRPWPARKVAAFLVRKDYAPPRTCFSTEEIKHIAQYMEDGGGRL